MQGRSGGAGSDDERGAPEVVAGWAWAEPVAPRRPGLPWLGVFLLALGLLLGLQQLVPELAGVGSLVVLAAGLAFLVSWLVGRGVLALHLGAILVALAAPELLAAAGVVEGPGVGTLALGVAFLAVAVVRAAGRAGWGWQAGLGTVLVLLGASTIALPGAAALAWPVVLVLLGLALVLAARRR